MRPPSNAQTTTYKLSVPYEICARLVKTAHFTMLRLTPAPSHAVQCAGCLEQLNVDRHADANQTECPDRNAESAAAVCRKRLQKSRSSVTSKARTCQAGSSGNRKPILQHPVSTALPPRVPGPPGTDTGLVNWAQMIRWGNDSKESRKRTEE
jgi:hypothetical protein